MKRWMLLLTLLAWLTGCGGLSPQKPQLDVSIESFRMVPGESMAPRFEIGLRVVNTSAVDVHVKGVVYRVYLQGRKVLTGAAHDLPDIPAYSEKTITVTGAPDLFETLGFFKDLMTKPNGAVEYMVDVGIDAGTLIPIIHTKKEGVLSLTGTKGR